MKKTTAMVLVFLVVSVLCFAQPVAEMANTPKYVASTSWVAAIAELAGIDDVVTIAPANLKHPPEYEITADDMSNVVNAELFMHAGYEKMMKTIGSASQLDPDRIVKVKTTNTLENLSNMVNMLSQKAGTKEEAAKRFGQFQELIENARKRIAQSPNRNIEVYANKNQAEFAKDLGLNVVSTFGAGALTAAQIEEAHSKAYPLVIDNLHSPVASPITQVSPDSSIITWRNFPDHTGGDALYNVVRGNLEMLWETGLF